MDDKVSIESINKVIKHVLDGENTKNGIITYDKFEKIIELFGLYKMKEIIGVKYVQFIITDLSNKNGVCCNVDCIKIDRKVIKNIFAGYKGCHAVFMKTIFHELAHFEFNYKILNGIYDEETISVLKEILIDLELGKARRKIFHKTIRDYYNLNYDVVSVEVMADIKSYVNMIIWFREMNINLRYAECLIIEDALKNCYKMADDKKRSFSGNRKYKAFKDMDVDKLFDDIIIDNPQWLEKFSCLRDEYFVDSDKKVRRRTNK